LLVFGELLESKPRMKKIGLIWEIVIIMTLLYHLLD
jgi:hypothetical protein